MTEEELPTDDEDRGEEDAEDLEERRQRMRDRRSFAARLAEGDTYGTLFILIILTYILMAVLEHSLWTRAITGVCFGGTLLLALHTSHVRHPAIRYTALGIVLLTVVINVLSALREQEPFAGASWLMVILVLASPIVILNRIFRHPVISVETIIGAIDAYLLIAITFATVYAGIDELGTGYFFAQGSADPVEFVYFSFVTITTLGFGDLTPGTNLGRVIVSLEAVLGQIFLVTIVALLVSNLGRETRRAPRHPRDASDASELSS